MNVDRPKAYAMARTCGRSARSRLLGLAELLFAGTLLLGIAGMHTARRQSAPPVPPQVDPSLVDNLAATNGGQVRGVVVTELPSGLGTQDVALPNATVYLTPIDATARVPGSVVATDPDGQSVTARMQAGTYRVCAEAIGFQSGCAVNAGRTFSWPSQCRNAVAGLSLAGAAALALYAPA